MVWVGSVLPCRLWALAGISTAAIVRWPAAIAAILAGFVLARSLKEGLGVRAACLGVLCWFGSVGLIDRSADAGIDLLAGLGTILALNRLLTVGAGPIAGLFAAWAFLAGGWPPLALIGVASILLGRKEASPNLKMIAPVVVAIAAWSAWALMTTRAEVWAAALSLPLTRGSAWTMALGVASLGLPWTPFALLALSPTIRSAWPESGRKYVTGWGLIAVASLVVGTVVPGLASASRLPALAGLAVVAAACWESILASGTELPASSRRWVHLAGLGLVIGWAALMIPWAGNLALSVGYYRPVGIVLIALAIGAATLAISSAWRADRRGALAALVLLAVSIKLVHFGHHVPEWNYRNGQGPWGRAIAQWVPRGATIHVLHGWPADLLFAVDRPIRQLADPRLLPNRPGPSPKFLLLLESEFDHWQDHWPKVIKVARFEDERGEGRVVARTEGEFSWRKSALEAAGRE